MRWILLTVSALWPCVGAAQHPPIIQSMQSMDEAERAGIPQFMDAAQRAAVPPFESCANILAGHWRLVAQVVGHTMPGPGQAAEPNELEYREIATITSKAYDIAGRPAPIVLCGENRTRRRTATAIIAALKARTEGIPDHWDRGPRWSARVHGQYLVTWDRVVYIGNSSSAHNTVTYYQQVPSVSP